MNKRKLVVKGLIIGIIVLAVIQQADFVGFSYAFIGRGISKQSKQFIQHEGKLGVAVDITDIQDDFIRLEGWGTNESPSKIERIYLYLRNETDSILISSIPVERQDVVDFLKSEAYRYTGYRVFFPTCGLKNGRYQLGFMIETNSNTQGKLMDQFISIQNPSRDSEYCARLNDLHISDHISLQRFYFRDVASFLPRNKKVSYISDTLPRPFNDIRAGEVTYGIVPLVLERHLRFDTLIGYFPVTKSITHPENPLYSSRENYQMLKDFGNGVMVLIRKPK